MNTSERTIRAFGEEWSRYDQTAVDETELRELFEQYFRIFPWDRLASDAIGADVGCGSGRWARFVAPRVGVLHCLDPSSNALVVARRNLVSICNVRFHECGVAELPFEKNSLDFVYSLGVLHHIPDTISAINHCVRVLKPGAPFLLYLYYALDNVPQWYKALWRISNAVRHLVVALPSSVRDLLCEIIAHAVYWPLARGAWLAERLGFNVNHFPLAIYRRRSLYTMRTDSRDRFGTPLEQRFTAAEVRTMMKQAGLDNIRLSESEPYWCAVGFKR